MCASSLKLLLEGLTEYIYVVYVCVLCILVYGYRLVKIRIRCKKLVYRLLICVERVDFVKRSLCNGLFLQWTMLFLIINIIESLFIVYG